jgi:hypothetical protein
MTDRTDTRVLTVRYQDGRGKRLEIEPREDGHFDVTERVLTKGGDWRPVGTETAEAVNIEE